MREFKFDSRSKLKLRLALFFFVQNLDLSDEMEYSKLQKAAGKIIINSVFNNIFETYIEPKKSEYKINIKKDNKIQFFVSTPKEQGELLVACLKNMAELDIVDKKTIQEGFILRNYKGREIKIKCATNPVKYGEMLVLTNFDHEVI